jgi:hypothetical protein
MATVEEAREILRALGLPAAQQTEIGCLTLLVLTGMTRGAKWADAAPVSLKVHDIMGAMARDWGKRYAENTRETVRRQVLHQFEQARVVDRNPDAPTLATNSPRTHYRITSEALRVARSLGGEAYSGTVARFRKEFGTLDAQYRKERTTRQVPVTLPDGRRLQLSPGPHNELQRRVVEQFLPTFVPDAVLVYLGDAAKKAIFLDERLNADLQLSLSDHGKLPDVIAWDAGRKLLLLIEVVTSHGPVSPKRETELRRMFDREGRRPVFITAFPTFAVFREHSAEIAWETEVWIAEQPSHMIHFNGPKFIGVYSAADSA